MKIISWLLVLIPLLLPRESSAHAFGQVYTLPIPVWLYLYGGATALVASFLVIGLFVSQESTKFIEKTVDLSKTRLGLIWQSRWLRLTIQLVSLLVWVLVIMAGLWGDQTPTKNLAPLYFWIIFILGLTYLSALFGNIWSFVSPIRLVARLVTRLSRRPKAYPKRLGYWPALTIYFLLIWLELLSRGVGIIPNILAVIIISYALVGAIGCYVFGEVWLNRGEVFNVLFGLIGQVAPIVSEHGKLKLRLPFVGLARDRVNDFGLLVFIIFMLSSTAFDGLRSTKTWQPMNYLIYPLFAKINSDPFVVFQLFQTILLLLSPLVFLGLYLIAIALMKTLARTKSTVANLALEFGFSLIPIALAYNIAHYYTLLLVQGQAVIALVSDPFNRGWNLFGSAGYTVNIRLLNAATVWNSQVAVIVGGHIIAVYIAHLIALRVFPSHKQAVVSQIPMLILMVIYTTAGLWILSQPLTVGS